ncbi:hypothetical protein B0H12DRAFT_1229849 [Mycena haematopus]|nr:hypothetical protein B0H12DRAFT_1229849 [Mycena haematopus]
MSSSPTQHFRDFRQRSSGLFGADLFFVNPEGFDFDSVPPYRLDAVDVQWPPSRPFFPVIQEERAVGDYQMSEDERKSIYFLRHPSIIRILPFLRRPRRFQRLSREYVVDLLDRAVPIFRTFARAYPFLPHTPLQEGLIRALVLFVQRVINRFPEHVSEHWRVIFMDQSHDYWTERPRMPPLFVSRGRWSSARIRSPTLVRLLEVLASAPHSLAPADVDSVAQALNHGVPALLQLARELRSGTLSPDFAHGIFNSTRSLIQLVPEGRRNRAWVLSLPPYNEIFGRSIFPRDFVFPDGAHENRNRTPFRFGTEFPSPESPPVLSPVPRVTPPLRSEGVSPVYVPTSPISSPPFGFSPVSPSTMETSALFRDDTLMDDQRLDALRGESTLPSQTLEELRADEPMPPVESTPPATQAFPSPPRSSAAFQRIASFRDANNPLANLAAYGPGERRSSRPGRNPLATFSLALPCRRTALEFSPGDAKTRVPPSIHTRSAELARAFQWRRKKTGKKSAAPSSQGDEPRFPPVFRRGRGRSSRTSAYEPEIPLEPFNTPRLAEELLAMMRQPEPTLFDVGCANCMLRNRECSHVTLGTLCPQCHTGKLAACSHQFTVSEHLRGINFLEQYTRLADAQGNRLVTAAMNAREAYNLARAQLLLASTQVAAAQNTLSRWITARLRNLGPTGIPGADEIPEALREDWDDMVDMGRKGLAKEYEFNLNSFPALFEHTSDVDFRGNRDARLNSAISSSRDLLEGLRVKRAAARETTPAGPPDEEFLRAHSSAAGPSHLDFVGTASSSANATAGPSRLDYVPPTSPRSRQAIELLQEQDREQAEKERKEREEAMDLDAPR